jgi:hypothetical protein
LVKLSDDIIKQTIRQVINNEDYRTEILSIVQAEFMEYATDLFKRIGLAHLRQAPPTFDWYLNEFLDANFPSEELVDYSRLHRLRYANTYSPSTHDFIEGVTQQYIDPLYEAIQTLAGDGSDIEITLPVKFRAVTIDLPLSKSLVVLSSLALKRATMLRWMSKTVEEEVEKRLMVVLCQLFGVDQAHYQHSGLTSEKREVDFFLIDNAGRKHLCEVKLMGRGNPESADAVIARQTDVFVADKLSDLNKEQLTGRGIHWVELRTEQGYRKFLSILQSYGIPATDFEGDVNERLDIIFQSIFNKGTAEI